MHLRINEPSPGGDQSHQTDLFVSEGLAHVELGDVLPVLAVLLQEDEEEGRDEVVDALHVARGRVADRPDVQDPLEDLLRETARPVGDRTLSLSDDHDQDNSP